MMTFMVSFTKSMTPKSHSVITYRRDLLHDPKGHGELFGRFDQKGHSIIKNCHDLVYEPKCYGYPCCRFELIYDPQRSQGQLK